MLNCGTLKVSRLVTQPFKYVISTVNQLVRKCLNRCNDTLCDCVVNSIIGNYIAKAAFHLSNFY